MSSKNSAKEPASALQQAKDDEDVCACAQVKGRCLCLESARQQARDEERQPVDIGEIGRVEIDGVASKTANTRVGNHGDEPYEIQHVLPSPRVQPSVKVKGVCLCLGQG